MSYLKSYKNFLYEAKSDDLVNVVLLSNFDEESYTAEDFKKAFEGKVKSYTPINVNVAKLKDIGDEYYEISDKDNKAKIHPENTVIITRRGVIKNTYTRNIVEDLEGGGFFVFNTLNSIINCENKYITDKILNNANLPTPKTYLIDNIEDINDGIQAIGGKFPVILKTLSGSQGIGVSIIDSLESLKSVLQTLWKLSKSTEVILQEKINSEYDLRIHVLTKKFNDPSETSDNSVLIGYMRRNKIDNDFRTNHTLGGTVEKTKVTEEQKNLSISAAKATGCNWCGVDLIVDEKTGKNYILEVNASPGTHGLKKATGIDVLKKIVDFAIDKSNWTRGRDTIGFREIIKIPGLGEFVCKFDTGNGSKSSSITYDKMEVSDDENYIEWELGGKKFKNEIIDVANTEVGDEVDTRYIINLDLVFRGRLYKDIDVALVDRKSKSTKFLANRYLMNRIGCAVSPSKVFVVTDLPEGYDAMKAKNKPHSGINFE